MEAGILDLVEGFRDDDLRVALGQVVDDLSKLLLPALVIDEWVVLRQALVEQGTTEGRLEQERLARLIPLRLLARSKHHVHPDLHQGSQVQIARIPSHDRLAHRGECVAFTDDALAHPGQVVQADDHVLAGQGDRTSI